MKRSLLFFAIVVVMAGCRGKNNKQEANTVADSTAIATYTASTANDSLVYEGTVPAADCAGIRYRIAMDARKKAFSMKEDYMESDTKVKDSFIERGTVEPYSKNGKKGLKLSTGRNGSELYFVSVGDSVLRMVNNELEEAVTKLNYDLKLKP